MKNRYCFFVIIFLISVFRTTFLMAQVALGDPKAVPVEFMFVHKLESPDKGVGINGNMNNWTGGIYPMKEVKPNFWSATLQLLPGTYEYKYVKYTDTVGQEGVTGYFTDPLNSLFGGPFNNSTFNVADPMVYYFLPKDGTTISDTLTDISVKIAVANESALDVDKIEFYLDGQAIPNARSLYNATTKTLTYKPSKPLSVSSHTARIKVFNAKGDTASMSTTFSIASGISEAPFTFIFDTKSPNFNFLSKVNRIDIKGTFNSEGLEPMSDPDGDGLYRLTRNLTVNRPEEYTVIVNGGSYINDPDNPSLSGRHRTQVIKHLITRPYFEGMDPVSGKIFQYPLSSLSIKTFIAPSDSGFTPNVQTLYGMFNTKRWSLTKYAGNGGYFLTANINNPVIGRHVFSFFGQDVRGYSAAPVSMAFGIYPPNTGFHYVDGEDDDKGSGVLSYPSGAVQGEADIREFQITASKNLDSLIFSIKMESIGDRTRLGFSIVNRLDGNFVEAPENVELRVPQWERKGIFILLAKPGSAYLNDAKENRVLVSSSPLSGNLTIQPNTAAISTGEFKFSLAISDLEKIMGSYKDKWYYGLFSYLKDNNGTIEAGESPIEDCDVYDAGFFSDTKIQERLLANYIPSNSTGGPRIATIGSSERGYMGISPSDIDTSLGKQPHVEIYAGGGELLFSPVRVAGFADMPAGSEVNIEVNGTVHKVLTNDKKEFSGMIPLQEGINNITASVIYGSGLKSYSQHIVYNYNIDHEPIAKIHTTVTGNNVTLAADSSYDPDGTQLIYKWSQDTANPATVNLSSNSSSVSFNLPEVKGEYYFTLTVNDGAGDTSWARAVVVNNGKSNFVPDMGLWHPEWVDSMVIYSVFVRTFDASGKFKAITSRMSELKDLGINCIWFLPIHPTTGNLGPDNPGYGITNYMEVLENYGTKEDLKSLIREAHKNGIRVILDQVIQHTSDLHPFMKDANKYKQNSPYYPFYMWDANNNFQYLFTWVDLPSINYEEQSTRDYLIRMAKYWVQEFDIDGYRCDVAHAINNLRKSGPAFWQRWRQELKAIKPDIFLLAEADAQTVPSIFDRKFDAAYDWTWFGRIKNVITGTGNIDSLNSIVEYYLKPSFPEHATTFKFLENQDEQRFIDAFGLGSTKVAAAHLLTAPGLPQLYAGQEAGEETNRGNINWSDPNKLRPYYKKLVNIRKNNPALFNGDFLRIENSRTDKLYSYLRGDSTGSIVVILNFAQGNTEASVNMPVSRLGVDTNAVYYMNDLLNEMSTEVKGADLKHYMVSLPANSAQILTATSEPVFTDVADEIKDNIPVAYELLQNYPNPFNPSTTIRYTLPHASHVNLSIFNILGQKVAELVRTEQTAGYHDVSWNASNLSSGIYIYRIEAKSASGTFISARKMLLIK